MMTLYNKDRTVTCRELAFMAKVSEIYAKLVPLIEEGLIKVIHDENEYHRVVGGK